MKDCLTEMIKADPSILKDAYQNPGKTELQKAMFDFGHELTDELIIKHGIYGGIGFVVDALIDVRNTKTTLARAKRMKSVKPSYVSHLKRELRMYEEVLHDCVVEHLDCKEEATPREIERFLKLAEQSFVKMVKFIREKVEELYVEADHDFVHDQITNSRDDMVFAMCNLISYDKAIPQKIRKLFDEEEVDLTRVPYTSTARNISKYVY